MLSVEEHGAHDAQPCGGVLDRIWRRGKGESRWSWSHAVEDRERNGCESSICASIRFCTGSLDPSFAWVAIAGRVKCITAHGHR